MIHSTLPCNPVPGSPVSWQTILADLSLILFLVTASALETDDRPFLPLRSKGDATAAGSDSAADGGDPLHAMAVWRAHAHAQPLRQWLEAQARDGRVSVLVQAHYPAHADAALQDQARRRAWEEANGLASQAQQAGHAVRLSLLPGSSEKATVSLMYEGMADAIGKTGPELAGTGAE